MAKKSPRAIVEALAIMAPTERVWEALTSPRDLGQLILGQVEMAPKPGARLRWQWGVWEKIAPRGGPGKYTWKGEVLDVVPGSTLVLGPEPVVTFTVKGEGSASLVTVIQGSAPTGAKLEDFEYGWADFLLKLKTQLETERLEREVLVRALLRAKTADVYRTWLSARAMSKILPGKAKIPRQAGQRFSWQHQLGKHVHQGVFLTVEKQKISFTWEAPKGSGPRSEVVLEAQPTAYGALVAVHHTGILGMHRGQLFGQRLFWLRLLERLRCYFYFKGKIKAVV